MSSDAGKNLFHAIVIAGAAIGGCAKDQRPATKEQADATAAQPAAGSSGQPSNTAGAKAVAGSGGTTGASASTGGRSGAGGAKGTSVPMDAAAADEDAGLRFPHITA